MSESTYSVYLVEQTHEQGGQREVTSPIQGNDVEFYESGAWLDRERGRNFFPYEQIRTIREHPEGQTSEDGSPTPEASEGGPTDDQSPEGEPATSDESDAAGDSPPEGGDSGAEEEMLEE